MKKYIANVVLIKKYYIYIVHILILKKNDGFTYTIDFNKFKNSIPDIYVIKLLNEEHICNKIFRYGKSVLIDDILYVFEVKDNLFILERLKKLQKIKENIL